MAPNIPSSDQATCPACGAPLSGDAVRCAHCGAGLDQRQGRYATRLLAPPSPLPEGYLLEGRFRILQVIDDAVDRVTYRAEDALACGHCGHVHQEPAAYCDQCGAELTQPAQLTLIESSAQPTQAYDAHIRFRGRDYYATYLAPEPVGATEAVAAVDTPALRWGQCTDIGRQRPHNEDAISCYVHLATGRQPLALLQVADGLGGQDAGEVASQLAIESAWDLICEQVWLPHLRGETDSYTAEYRLRHAGGHWVWVMDAGRVLERDDDGKPLRAVGVHQDISERKSMEASLLQLATSDPLLS